jgi:hypothetical protein
VKIHDAEKQLLSVTLDCSRSERICFLAELIQWQETVQGAESKVINSSVLTASCSPCCPQHDSPLCSPEVAADTPCDHLPQLHGQVFVALLHRGHSQEPHSAATAAHTDGDLAIKQYLGQASDTLTSDLKVLYLQHQVTVWLCCVLVILYISGSNRDWT